MKKSELKQLIKEVIEDQQFETWIKQAQPGLSQNDLAYDIAREAWDAGKISGQKPPSEADKKRWNKEKEFYGTGPTRIPDKDERRSRYWGTGPTGLRGDPQ